MMMGEGSCEASLFLIKMYSHRLRVLNDYKRFYQRASFDVFYIIFAEPKNKRVWN